MGAWRVRVGDDFGGDLWLLAGVGWGRVCEAGFWRRGDGVCEGEMGGGKEGDGCLGR